MGEVYRARDTQLKRSVALKVLPGDVARDPDRLSRFQREAEILASLNHTNIAQVYGIAETDGVRALVMELVEGPTLSDRLSLGSLPLDEALDIAKQIAEALDAAHDRGVVHRDLKPANIKVTSDGHVKVLDFGLAKALDTGEIDGPTITSPAMTRAGVILGTAAYMSPEQARGRSVDPRTDVWAFGCVLFEMLTGHGPFEGNTITDVLGAIVHKEPAWSTLPADTPESLRRLLHRCLAKDQKQRLHNIADARLEIEDVLAARRSGSEEKAPGADVRSAPGMSRREMTAWTLAASAVVTLTSVFALWAPWRGTSRPSERPSVRLDLDLGALVSLGSGTGPSAILSPDGTRLVFVSQGQDEIRRLFTRLLDQPNAAQMPGTDGAYAPFFSPDGQWVGFFAQGKLKKARIDGGEPVSLCDAPGGRGASWSEDGYIIAALDPLAGLSRIPADGGTPVTFTTLKPGENTHRWPQVLPGGQAVLFITSIAYGNYDEATIELLTLKDHQRRTLMEHAGMYPRYSPSGHLLYVTKGTLFARPFDPERLEVRGDAQRLMEVSSNPNLGSAQFDVSRTGTLVYRVGHMEGLRTIQWLDAAGKTDRLWDEPAYYLFLRLSPDGSRVASLATHGGNTDLWTYDWHRGSKNRLTNGLQDSAYPVWSYDGQFVVFHSVGGIFWTRADGASKPQLLTQSPNMQLPTSFTPDGKQLAFSEMTAGGAGEIRTVPVDYSSGQMRAGKSQLFIKTATANAMAAFSPDGRWLAYADAEAGRYEVFVRTFPDKGKEWQISSAGGTWPTWSRNGHELFYNTEDQRIMVVNYSVKEDSFVPDKPRVWYGKPLANIGLGGTYDITADGKRLAVVMPPPSAEPREVQNHLTVVVNFFDELWQRVAAQAK